MEKSSSNYSRILKGTAIFGGVQVFNILINLIKGKLVAVILGPEGMGISSLLTSSMNTIQQCTGLGLNLSSIQEISPAYERKDINRVRFIVSILRRLLYISALIGSLVSIFFSYYLSVWTFGSDEYKWYFVLLSVCIFFTTLTNGELSILQGIHAVKKLALASIIGSSTGLIIGIPLYYFLGYDGIVPSMIALSLATFVFYKYNTYRLLNSYDSTSFKWKTMVPVAKKMIMLGGVMMCASLLGTLMNYIVNTYISKNGSLEDVGLFQAANSITNQYIGLVFASMGMDFYPRLSAVSYDNNKVRQMVNQQMEILLIIVVPLASLLIITAPLIIDILLTEDFLSLVPIIRWMGLGIALKAFSFSMGYISFAKGDKKTFFWLEGVWSNILQLSLNIIFYKLWGIYGLGISFVAIYGIGIIIYMFITNKLYDFKISLITLKLFNRNLFFLLLIFGVSFFTQYIISYVIMSLLFIVITLLCIIDLNKRTNIFNNLKEKFIQKH